MRSIIPASVSQSRLDRTAERRQRSISSRTSGLFDSQLTTAMARTAGAASTARTTSASRQTLAASSATRQNSVTSAATRVEDDPARQTAPSGTASAQEVTNPFFGPLVAAAAKASAAAAAAKKEAAALAAATAPAAAAVSEPKPMPQVAMETLHEALRKANIEPTSLNLYYEEIPVYYPGGSYTNKFITYEVSPTRKESYDVNLMMKNPWLTVFEMTRFMSSPA